ncbi:ATPase [Streptomyces lunaelactis]|uniref:Autoinducer 2 import system permease protein LsrD n=1 Tax=Streptomyces lunaelactis TaxID=1535768 RepID=A0A2R4SX13_9ACTN|nr:ABC transporter permease [Streptomyces lunaelactis]AVZ71430.1 ATPase [Streptomyces lunaelactis]NUJ99618.1 ABC transporter permease [Streptomyces lunaelactis]NUK09654.1 ABC transporter permease [Streptomyces lunaelactis]NUK17093.1 ABC transporter permease [Streptomyces lunaelactis]NUK23601.1 ABC transporter permease [Streptomyces lunaelactis]
MSALTKYLRWDTAVGILLIAVFLAGTGTTEGFSDTANLSAALDDTAEIALIALPMTLLVVAGQVDLSVASMLGLSSALAGSLWDAGWTFELIVPVCLLAGALGGLLNGWLVTRIGLPSLAVTIGTLTLYRGLASVALGDKAVADFPEAYAKWARYTETVPGTFVPYPVALFAVLAVVAAVVLHCTGFGRSLFAIGAQEEAAHFAGIRVKRIKLALFMVSGLVASFAGIVYTLRYGSARADNGVGLELVVIASVLLGGIDFDGGRGTLGGAVAGVLLIGLLNNLLTLNDVSNEIQVIVTGLLLVASVLTPRVIATLGERRHRHAAAAPAK